MALPMNTTPTYNMVIPSTGESVKFRPFFVKEEKALLLAQQSEDPVVMVDTLKGIIQSCVQDKIDVSTLASFDIEYMFTQIRARSVGEIIELIFSCDDCDSKDAKVKISFDLTKLEVEKSENHKRDILLFDDVGVRMKYPDLNTIKKVETTDINEIDEVFNSIIDCIEFIYTTDEIYNTKEQSRKELMEFIENLTTDQFSKIQEFFETMPVLRQDVDYTCPVCGKEHHKYIQGIAHFF